MKSLNFLSKCKIEISYTILCLRKKIKASSLVIYAVILFGCNHHPVYYSESVESKIEIIGKETCNQNEGDSWLVNVESTTGSKKVLGVKVIVDGTEYDNVVKTNFDLSEYADSDIKYYMVTGDEITSTPYPCSLSEDQISPINANAIPVISIHKIELNPR